MKTTSRLAALLVALASLPSLADDSQPYPVELLVGASLDICTTGTILCPATAPICDDPQVATLRDGKAGMELVGLKPGTTLCSAGSTNLLRRVYRVTVKPPPPPDGGKP